MIVVKKFTCHPSQTFTISEEEDIIVRRVFEMLGLVAAVRTARAFAKCDLASAMKYVRSFNNEEGEMK